MSIKVKAYYLLIGFFCFISYCVSGQDQKLADSLANIYKDNKLEDTAKLELLKNLAFNEGKDIKQALQYAEELINLSKVYNNNIYLSSGYFQKGNKNRLLGNLPVALEAYVKSGEAAMKIHFIKGEGRAYMAIADIHSLNNDHPNAMLYYRKAISTLQQSDDPIALASAILNAGDEFIKNKNYDSALLYFKESTLIFEKANYLSGKAYSRGGIGMVYKEQGKYDLAKLNINEAIRMLEVQQDYSPISDYLINLSIINEKEHDLPSALTNVNRSLQLATDHGLKEQISAANLQLSSLYEKAGNFIEAYKYYKNHIVYRDSIINVDSVKAIANKSREFEVTQKETEVNLLKQQKRNQHNIVIFLFIILGLGLVLLLTLYWYYQTIKKEKRRSEKLLLNILPFETAEELKQNGKVAAKKFDKVTVLFTDFKEFAKLAEYLEPEQLVKSIDFYFKEFDAIITRHELEKIKTIGDSYMCACGLPAANQTNARNIIHAAKEMIDIVNSELKSQDNLIHFEIRIGIHTGPVVAGIVGIKKWQYDIWGDTVNIASRMESMSETGRVNMSETTYNEIKDEFSCEYRGEIEVKNRGLMKMYFLGK